MTRPIFTSNKDDWETPQYLFDKLNAAYNFTLDPCSTHENAKCTKHYTKAEDGLAQSWQGETVFMNPPFGKELKKWVKKAWDETHLDDADANCTVVAILPARTDTSWWHDYVSEACSITFLKGRVKYEVNGKPQGNSTFPTVLVKWIGMEQYLSCSPSLNFEDLQP